MTAGAADNFERLVYVQGKDARANDESHVADEIVQIMK
jgi:hypothetical protein